MENDPVSPASPDQTPAPRDPEEAAFVVGDAFLPYPKSTLSPRIVPNDLTDFRSRNAAAVQKETARRLHDLAAEYRRVAEEFNWNKLIYESGFEFQPVIGETYHLYRKGDGFQLSLVPPEEWKKRFVGSFVLGVNGKWSAVRVADGFSLQDHLASG